MSILPKAKEPDRPQACPALLCWWSTTSVTRFQKMSNSSRNFCQGLLGAGVAECMVALSRRS